MFATSSASDPPTAVSEALTIDLIDDFKRVSRAVLYSRHRAHGPINRL